MSQDQGAGQIHNIKNNSSFERMEQFKYLGTWKEWKKEER